MEHKLFIVLVILVMGNCTSDRIASAEQGSKSTEYVGISHHYAEEANGLLKNSTIVDYESRQLRIYAGKYLKDSYRMECEIIFANIKEQGDIKKEEILYGIQTGILYDILRFDKFNLFTGVLAGLGYLNHPTGYVALGEESPFGLFDGRLGVEYIYNKKISVRAQVGVWHISSAFNNDQGQNYRDFSVHIGYRY